MYISSDSLSAIEWLCDGKHINQYLWLIVLISNTVMLMFHGAVARTHVEHLMQFSPSACYCVFIFFR